MVSDDVDKQLNSTPSGIVPYQLNEMILVNAYSYISLADTEKRVLNTITLSHALTANEDTSPVTVLLVVSGDDFDHQNINGLIDSFNTLLSIFPDFDQIKDGLGLVISMSDDSKTAKMYMDDLAIGTPQLLQPLYDHFS